MYFEMFPKIEYDLLGNGNSIFFTDITKRSVIRKEVLEQISNFDFYDVQNGESAEIIADVYYQNIFLHWIVLMANNITNLYEQWPKSLSNLESYIDEKYGDNANSVHHYVINQTSGDTTKEIILTDNTYHSNATTVSNYQYEVDLNDSKRRIRLIRPEFVSQIIEEYRYNLESV